MSLNNATKQQFASREASFSTHGSRRGYSDLGEALKSIDMLPIREKREVLIKALSIAKEKTKSQMSKTEKSNLNTLIRKVEQVNRDIKEHNSGSCERVELKMNKAVAFMATAKKYIPQDLYNKIMKDALEYYGFNDKSDGTIKPIKT